jgi:hypothetical protein
MVAVPAEIRIYFEGDKRLEPGFKAFLRELRNRANEKGCRLRPIPAKSGDQACQDFNDALQTHSSAWNILLIDSEGPLDAVRVAALCKAFGWRKPVSRSIFWMVEMMEAWLHADKDALATFYGRGFKRNALSADRNVESISKRRLEEGLRAATKNSEKGDYFRNKTLHGPQLLALINPTLVRQAAPNCNRLFQAILAHLN